MYKIFNYKNPDSNNKCYGCNNDSEILYLYAEDKEQAEILINSGKNGTCSACFAELLEELSAANKLYLVSTMPDNHNNYFILAHFRLRSGELEINSHAFISLPYKKRNKVNSVIRKFFVNFYGEGKGEYYSKGNRYEYFAGEIILEIDKTLEVTTDERKMLTEKFGL